MGAAGLLDPADPAVLLSARGVSKSFAGVEVLRDVDLDLHAGEVHALLGENGAGKSTFAKILAGVHRASRGTITLGGLPVDLSSPIEAQLLGITLIHQEPISFPDLSVAENLVLGRADGGALARVRWAEQAGTARRLMGMLGVELDVTRPMRGLSIADQQMVEIARALASDSRLIIMDEPTAALTPKEVETLFAIVGRLRGEGRTLIFISHRLEEVRAICDRVTIFRDGEKVATAPTGTLTDADIIRLMIGRPLKDFLHKGTTAIGDVALSVAGLTLPGRFEGIGFEVHRGEVVGLGGLVGAGRTDVARALFGIAPARSGRIRVNGRDVSIREPADAIALGIAFVPEDRAVAGLFRALSVESNITAAVPGRIAPRGLIRRHIERTLASDAVAKLRIRLAGLRQPIGELSGGNQQKAILARWLLTDPHILILDEPTRGIDIGVKAEFYDMIGELAAAGRAILLISSELPELLALSDRILVMSEGRLTATIPRAEATQEAVMQAAVPRGGRHHRAWKHAA
jgi:rhamnose transport system ATP-binding protein